MTTWEFWAQLVMNQTDNREECIEALSALLNIFSWEAERLIDQINFKKSLDKPPVM